ncbi:MAG TPA: P-II family nitrogen regulator [Kofleriaceae bacterium]|nr:P-II family nitrogen regulator [Kofleriaceae bacterium]
MKEVRAYVRENMASAVVQALVSDGWTDFSILEVRGIAEGLPAPAKYDYSVGLGDLYERIIKFEVVCRDDSADRLAELIRSVAYTGQLGDGMVFIAPVDEALRIRTGERGDATLPK